jgi:hypothetical protein
MNEAANDVVACAKPRAQSERPFPSRGSDDADDFTVKDVIDFSPAPTSRWVRQAFEARGWAVKRFVKMPGRNFFCLQVRAANTRPPATKRQARQLVAKILDLVGLRPGRDDLMVDGIDGGLMIGLGAALEDVKESAGFLEL